MEKHITELLLRSQGIDVSKYNNSFLDKSLQKRISETHCDSTEAYYNLLEQDKKEGVIFLGSLQISYSEFFRNPLTFAVLERLILPYIAARNRKNKQKGIRIWSAACAAGQETYSLAILLEELKNAGNQNISFRIFSTDQSASLIKEASEGKYSTDALDNLNFKRVKQWFSKCGDTYNVKPELKKNIDFSVFDLLNGQYGSPPASIFGDFDLVVCANLLFYYKPEYQVKIIEKICNCLADGAYLITGETEREILMRQNLHEAYPHSAIFRR